MRMMSVLARFHQTWVRRRIALGVAAGFFCVGMATTPLIARAATTYPVTISAGSGLIADSRNSNALVSTLTWNMLYADALPSVGRYEPCRRLVGFTGTNKFNKSGSLVAAPGGELGYAMAEMGEGLASYSLADLVAISKDLSTNGTDSPYYATFNEYAKEGATRSFILTNNSKLMVRLVGINHDTLASDLDGYGEKAGLSFLASHALPVGRHMNTSATNTGGWNTSALRKALNPQQASNITTNGDLWELLPPDLKNNIVGVQKTTTKGGGSTTLATSNDYLWLPSQIELNLGTSNAGAEGSAYSYFKDNSNASTNSLAYSLAGEHANDSYVNAWLRSPYCGSTSTYKTTCFLTVSATGNSTNARYDNANNEKGVVVGFCL